jgi:acyl-coenzyme A thioesterase 13
VAPGKVRCELTVEEEHSNSDGTLHTGFSATMVDVISTMAIETATYGRPGGSIDLNVTCLEAARVGEHLVIDSECLKVGKSLATAVVDVRNQNGTLIWQGRQTKHL